MALDLAQGTLFALNILHCYLAQNVDIVVIVLVLFLVFVVEDHLFLGVVDGGLEDLVGPRVLLAPVVFLGFVLEVVAADVWIPVANTDVDALVLENS